MPATKGWAYLTEQGRERISAYRVKVLRAKNGGRSLGIPFWSTHGAGQRFPMKYSVKQGTPFFSYMPGYADGGGGGGVSLSHLLYQEAIAQLSATELRLGQWGNHQIQITGATIEKRLDLPTGRRFVDVYLAFDSESYLAKKWGGAVCVEVWHTHPVPPAKLKDLRCAGVAVIEVRLPKAYAFRHHEDATTEELEAVHTSFLVRQLSNYIVGAVLSDPSSAEYLQEQLTALECKLAEAQETCQQQQLTMANLAERSAEHQALNTSLASLLHEAQSRIASLDAALNSAQQEKRAAASKAENKIELLRQRLFIRTQHLALAVAASVVLLGTLVYVTALH